MTTTNTLLDTYNDLVSLFGNEGIVVQASLPTHDKYSIEIALEGWNRLLTEVASEVDITTCNQVIDMFTTLLEGVRI